MKFFFLIVKFIISSIDTTEKLLYSLNDKFLKVQNKRYSPIEVTESIAKASSFKLKENGDGHSICLEDNEELCIKFQGDKKNLILDIIEDDLQFTERIRIDSDTEDGSVKLIIDNKCITNEANSVILAGCKDLKSQKFHMIETKVKAYRNKNTHFFRQIETPIYLEVKNQYVSYDDGKQETAVNEFGNMASQIVVENHGWRYRLATSSDFYLDYSNPDNVEFRESSSLTTQEFFLNPMDSQTAKIETLSRNLCVTVGEKMLVLKKCQTSDSKQKFKFIKELTDGKPFYFKPADKSGFFTTDEDGNNVFLSPDSSIAVKFELNHLFGNLSTIFEPRSKKHLSVVGTEVKLMSRTPTPFSIAYYEGNLFSIKYNVDFCLTFNNKSNKLVMMKCSASPSQIFEMFENVEDKTVSDLLDIQKNLTEKARLSRFLRAKYIRRENTTKNKRKNMSKKLLKHRIFRGSKYTAIERKRDMPVEDHFQHPREN